MGKDTPIQMVPDTSNINEAGSIIDGLSRVPAPNSIFTKTFIDPNVVTTDSCDRDYNMRCPVQYADIGTISGGTTRYCSPGSDYMGPCDKAEDFSKLSRKAMVRWSNQCQAYWPCIGCLRDYRELCPQEWARVGDELKCKPPATYSGVCSGITDFIGYNIHMKHQWSAACGVFWPCLADAELDETQVILKMQDATLRRIANGLQ